MIIHEFEQHTEEWYNIRLGRFTATNASAIKTGGVGLETLCFEKAAEILTKQRKPTFQSEAMAQGNELEPLARTLFEMETGLTVKQVGFVEVDEFSGFSPDGLIYLPNETTGVEIKSPQDYTYAKFLYDEKIKPEYYAQMQMQMMFADAHRWFYAVFNPHFEKQMKFIEVKEDKDFQSKLAENWIRGKKRVQEIISQIKEKESCI